MQGANPDGLSSAYRRAKLAWYTIDQTYYTSGQSKPQNISSNDPSLSNHYTRGIERSEIFPNRDLGATGNSFEFSFDMAYYPGERGQYNYTPEVSTTDERKFANQAPTANAARYGGISREITFDTDFDNANVEYLEFWLMDPFIAGPNGQINDSENAPRTILQVVICT
ncbi:hypothetical protein [Hymenobacter radiodurans]|uniref:hypothetical protein n=1 Tax=Hymenobacter radiodurans TaxID=2496028 RepID=UPI001058B651|nr:hypothetical protein [Hymenobacter radiodurans]